MTEQKQKKQEVLQVASVPEATPEKVVLPMFERLRNGEWGHFSHNYTAWADRTPEAFERAQLLKPGHEVLVSWTETPAKTGKGVYRDIISLERPPAADRPSSAALPSREGLPVPGEAPQAAQEAPKGPPEQPARTPLPPKPLEAPQKAALKSLGIATQEWSPGLPAHSQKVLGALEYRDRAIMAQVALKEAMQTVREWLTRADKDGLLPPPISERVLKLLRELTLAGYEAQIEAIRGGEA